MLTDGIPLMIEFTDKTGLSAIQLYKNRHAVTMEYVEWLEQKVRDLKSQVKYLEGVCDSISEI